MPTALPPSQNIDMIPDAEALSSCETISMVYAFKMAEDTLISVVLTTCKSPVQYKTFEEGMIAKGTADRPCVKVIVATGPILSLNFGASRLATPITAFEIANRTPISASVAKNLDLR